jgi:biofilm protein TabA
MIIDHIGNLLCYRAVHPLFPKAIDFLLRADTASLEPGRHEIDGDRVYALAMETRGGGKRRARLETHRKYIDIQYTLSGEDIIGWSNVLDCRIDSLGYQERKDVAVYMDRPCVWTTVRPRFFAIFFPQDAHAPLAGGGRLAKVVVKVAVTP